MIQIKTIREIDEIEEVEKSVNFRLDEFQKKGYKIIDVKYNHIITKYGNNIYSCIIIYDDKPRENYLSDEIKKYIDNSICEGLKDIREIYNDFNSYKK